MRVPVGLAALVFGMYCTFAYAQSSGSAGSGGGAGSAAGAGSGSTVPGSMVNGTGGSPGPDTSDALRQGTTGCRLGSFYDSRRSDSSSPASGFANDGTMNKAVQDLGNTNTGIISPKH
jgi:hypothetical protein